MKRYVRYLLLDNNTVGQYMTYTYTSFWLRRAVNCFRFCTQIVGTFP